MTRRKEKNLFIYHKELMTVKSTFSIELLPLQAQSRAYSSTILWENSQMISPSISSSLTWFVACSINESTKEILISSWIEVLPSGKCISSCGCGIACFVSSTCAISSSIYHLNLFCVVFSESLLFLVSRLKLGVCLYTKGWMISY